MIEIHTLVSATWALLQPYLPVLGKKAAEELGKDMPSAAISVWRSIQKRFGGEAAARDVLDEFLKNPDDGDAQGAFRLQLRKLLEKDNTFALDLESLLRAAGVNYTASLEGDGAVAQGPGAKAVGKGGILIEGDVHGSNVIRGNRNTVSRRKRG